MVTPKGRNENGDERTPAPGMRVYVWLCVSVYPLAGGPAQQHSRARRIAEVQRVPGLHALRARAVHANRAHLRALAIDQYAAFLL